jgi:ABC-type sugar transport system permease subunit
MSTTTHPVNQKAWFLILPVLICVAFSAIIPLMTVVNYSVQDIISPERRVFVGTEWFKSVMRDDDLQGALLRQITFSLSVLLVEIPLGIALALAMPAKGWKSSAVLLRFMDSFMIYTEPFVLTGGGPGNATTFLSQYLTQKAVGQFDLGPAAAFSLIYFLIILALSFILYNWMQRVGTADKSEANHG